MSKQVVFIGCPAHSTQLEWDTATAIMANPSQDPHLKTLIVFQSGSLLAGNFNQLWAMALNNQKQHKIKWFAMLHADVAPEKYWLDKMIAIAEKHDADLLSAVVPFKDKSGLTSTALSSDDPYLVRSRLTLAQVQKLPATFDAGDVCKLFEIHELPLPMLLVNTGCMLLRLDRSWSPQVYFTINDQLRQNNEGKYYSATEPEDWFISRLVHGFGGKVMATREVKAQHIGMYRYDNQQVWGSDVDVLLDKTTNGGGIWSLEEAKQFHMHSPGLAKWLCENLDRGIAVYDFGCGPGFYVKKLEEKGFDATGYEGTAGIENIAATKSVEQMDITKMYSIDDTLITPGQVVCLEVMEHIDAAEEDHVLMALEKFCDKTLVLSWAIPGQVGHGHINCRTGEYVRNKMQAYGFEVDEAATASARAASSGHPTQFFNDTLYVFRRI